MTDDKQLPLEPTEWSAPLADKPMTVEQAKADLDIGYNHVPAGELKGQSFTIVSAQTFHSALTPGSDPFFVLCRDEKSGELWTTVLGGKQPVEFLMAYISKGGNRPLAVTLNFVEQGTFDGYYVIE